MKGCALPMLFAAPLLTACLREELPVPAVPRGDVRSVQLCMGPGYRDQLWFDLGTASVVAVNDKFAWDLAFESAPGGWRIMINGARLMTVWDIGAVDIAQPADTAGMFAARRVDAPSGHPDSTAFGDWRGTGHVYVVDLGFDPLGLPAGLRKVKPLSVTADAYTLHVARMDGSDPHLVTVPKDPQRGWTHYRFGSGVVQVEPPRGSWDFVLTQYTHEFRDPYLAYIVTGVLTDRGRVRVAELRDADFASVSLADTLAHPFMDRRDAIGYDWKAYSFDAGAYTVDARRIYIVHDAGGWFHKLRFVEFYGPQGQAGCPVLEVQPL